MIMITIITTIITTITIIIGATWGHRGKAIPSGLGGG